MRSFMAAHYRSFGTPSARPAVAELPHPPGDVDCDDYRDRCHDTLLQREIRVVAVLISQKTIATATVTETVVRDHFNRMKDEEREADSERRLR